MKRLTWQQFLKSCSDVWSGSLKTITSDYVLVSECLYAVPKVYIGSVLSKMSLASNAYSLYKSGFSSIANINEWHEDPICSDNIVDILDCPRCSVCGKKVML